MKNYIYPTAPLYSGVCKIDKPLFMYLQIDIYKITCMQ